MTRRQQHKALLIHLGSRLVRFFRLSAVVAAITTAITAAHFHDSNVDVQDGILLQPILYHMWVVCLQAPTPVLAKTS